MDIRFGGFFSRFTALYSTSDAFKSHVAGVLFTPFVSKIVHIDIGMLNYDAIVVLHKTWDAIYSGYVPAELFDIPAIIQEHQLLVIGYRL